MTIQMTFDSFDDMKDSILRMAGDFLHEPNRVEIKTPELPQPEKEIPEKAEKAPEKAPEKEEPRIDKVEMRKLLSVLNKSTGENTARKLINGMGFKALTDVPDDRLAELKAKAEEVINAQ